jgi:L-cysteine S-thiosulfotransferase
MKTKILVAAGGALALAGCASMMYTPPSKEETMMVIRSSFQDRGIAKVDRLHQTELQKICSDTQNQPSQDGKFLGDFKQGERIAQTGRGLQWNDKAGESAGGNCYACHQISKEEISFGNIGPTLYNYGKLRGNSDAVVKYTWAKIWNTHSYNACSSMPRFGDAGILTEEQIRDVMALLLDPKSPVNQ